MTRLWGVWGRSSWELCGDRRLMLNRKTVATQHTACLLAAAVIALGAATAQAQVGQRPDAPVQEAPDIPAPKRNAAKLAGLVGFVNLHCDTLRTDQDRFTRAIQSMGVDPAELDRDILLLQARSYLAAYQKDVPGSCRKAEALFGRDGRIIPGLFLAR